MATRTTSAMLLSQLIAILSSFRYAAAFDWQWRPARATVFGNNAARNSYCRPEDHDISCWSIHKGNCGYGYIFSDEPSGWDVAAISDQFSDFSGSCGRCVEVKCNPTVVKDGYGSQFDRKDVCRNPEASVVVRIVDACPCNYPMNYYSNKRWCCGDAYHVDLSVWAFEKLAEVKWGVIGLQYRAVPCSYTPRNTAGPISNPTPGQAPPPGAVNPMWSSNPTVPPSNNWSPQQSGSRYQSWGASSPSTASTSSGPFKDTQLQQSNTGHGTIFDDKLQNGWWDRSWKSDVNWSAGTFGPHGKSVACATVYAYGAVSVRHKKGAFHGQGQLQFHVKTDQGTPDISINIGDSKNRCSAVKLLSLAPSDERNGWSKYHITLSQFANRQGSYFNGCGGIGSWDITDIEFKNTKNLKQGLCISHMLFLN